MDSLATKKDDHATYISTILTNSLAQNYTHSVIKPLIFSNFSLLLNKNIPISIEKLIQCIVVMTRKYGYMNTDFELYNNLVNYIGFTAQNSLSILKLLADIAVKDALCSKGATQIVISILTKFHSEKDIQHFVSVLTSKLLSRLYLPEKSKKLSDTKRRLFTEMITAILEMRLDDYNVQLGKRIAKVRKHFVTEHDGEEDATLLRWTKFLGQVFILESSITNTFRA